MGRSPCCDKVGLKKGPWTPEEDQKLLAYIEEHGHGSWRALPGKAGLQRCGKSCRLRWTNYLRPDIKRGKFSLQEEQTIIQLHALLGNRWSAIATHLPKRTDNEIKNYWNTHLKKRLAKMGIDPVTHKPRCDALGSVDGQNKSAANLSHMAQWESARLEAEARLVRESKLRTQASFHSQSQAQQQLGTSSASLLSLLKQTTPPPPPSPPPPAPCLDVFKAWQWQSQGSVWSKSSIGGPLDLESPTSTLSFSENAVHSVVGFGHNSTAKIDSSEAGGGDWRGYGNGNPTLSTSSSDEKAEVAAFPTADDDDMVIFPTTQGPWSPSTTTAKPPPAASSSFVEGFTDLLLENSDDDDKNNNDNSEEEEEEDEDEDDANNYWNNILNLVDSSPPDSPLF
ncbi:hypothetical protein AAC387_Pa01g0004 [Persea americana]